MLHDDRASKAIAEAVNTLAPWYLPASYAYYIKAESLLPDTRPVCWNRVYDTRVSLPYPLCSRRAAAN